MSEQHPRATLFGTEERTLFSTIRGREYRLTVALPDSYKTSTQAYPVIYVLDGDFNFGVAAGLTRFSHWFRKVPELIIVGIGYDMETADEFAALRDLDFDIPGVPGASSESVSHLFLDAITQEMIPFINANYRTIPSDRCLQGYSSGGFFVLYALFRQPDAFQRYISGSAILKSTYDYWIHHDEQLAARNGSNPIQLYLSVGELEEDDIPNFRRFVTFLEQGNYPGLTVSSEIYAGEGHGAEGIALTYLHGIAKVYPQVEL
ncbi:alpha/beta hydrolase [Ktedonosporobacter rubrisoli]|uniref:Alpha/beta hydrolase n=1 Tax=Ktedonosporobacter rubrisoli TaxID=2509675 RepID=A0A4P6JKJ7_KTERU|nr:alpha/beta hydrolase-fold protein [Ktedonosporobacter rubrisoli]QBD75583.1 alpha/beta hydrolase [Ktedonosporobacter rubrisoli]